MISPEAKAYLIQRAPQLGHDKKNIILASEVKEKFNEILKPNHIYDFLRKRVKGIKADESPVVGIPADKKIAQLSEFLENRKISVKDLEELFYHKDMNDSQQHEIRQGTSTIKIGVVSDTHLGSKKCAIQELHDFYDIMQQEGVKHVLHAGDLCDGNGKVYPGQLDELMVYGFDDAIQYIIENYPKRDGMQTHYILGNHDESFKKTSGADIGYAISEKRDDMKYLGFYHADVFIDGLHFGLHHGAGGGAYAQSYKLQKAVEGLTGNRKPQIYILGHYHGSLFMAIRNMQCLLPASFQRATNFSIRLNLPEIIGGYILEITKTDKNEIRTIRPHFTQYYF